METKLDGHRGVFVVISLLIILLLFSLSSQASGPAHNKSVVIINLKQEIDPGTSQMFASALEGVSSTNVRAIVINMNTPGGILSDMQKIVSDIQKVQSKGVPVYTYIDPDGWGASAGSYIAIASNKIYMGPGSFIGPSTPFIVGGNAVEQNHVQNAMEKYMQALAIKNGHNSTAAVIMVKNNTAYSYSTALRIGLINGIASNLSDFISIVHLAGFTQFKVTPSIYDQFLSFLSNTIVDGILILLGVIAIIVDFSHATIVLSVSGVVLILLGFIGLEIVSASLIGLILLLIGVFLIILELKTAHGVALVSGVGVGLLGAFLMTPDYISSNTYNPASPLNTENIILILVSIGIALFVAYYLKYIFSSLIKRVQTGTEGMIGKEVTCKTELNPTGWVSYEGQQWKARVVGDKQAKSGDKMIIIGRDGLILLVDHPRERTETSSE